MAMSSTLDLWPPDCWMVAKWRTGGRRIYALRRDTCQESDGWVGIPYVENGTETGSTWQGSNDGIDPTATRPRIVRYDKGNVARNHVE